MASTRLLVLSIVRRVWCGRRYSKCRIQFRTVAPHPVRPRAKPRTNTSPNHSIQPANRIIHNRQFDTPTSVPRKKPPSDPGRLSFQRHVMLADCTKTPHLPARKIDPRLERGFQPQSVPQVPHKQPLLFRRRPRCASTLPCSASAIRVRISHCDSYPRVWVRPGGPTRRCPKRGCGLTDNEQTGALGGGGGGWGLDGNGSTPRTRILSKPYPQFSQRRKR